jgi:NAD(P)-dependent dehydrogenase (short-subunit alcohol dehydrogenase family)
MSEDSNSPHSLEGSIAVVTGAAQGLGLGIVEQLARHGATAIIADLHSKRPEQRPSGCNNKA